MTATERPHLVPSPGPMPSGPPTTTPPDAAPKPPPRPFWRPYQPTHRKQRARRPSADRGVGASLLHGASWNTAAELAPVVVNITLTPFLIHGLGIQQYGIYALSATITIFLSSFDGGLGGASQRFFAVNAGRNDKGANTRLLTSLVLVILVGGAVLSGIAWGLAPWLSGAFHLPHRYRPGAVFLLRTFGILITVQMILGLFTALLQAHQRFSVTSKLRVASYLAWAVGLYLTVVNHDGLEGVALALVAEQIVICVSIFFTARHLDRSAIGLLSRSDLGAILRFGANVQARGLTSLVNTQFDALIIGAVLPVVYVGLYNAGANPAAQLFFVTFAAGSPVYSHLGRVFGESGERAALAEMAKAQRMWVAVVAGLVAVEAGSAYFAVRAWLGHQFGTSAWVTVLLLCAYGFTLLAAVLTNYTIAIGRPRIQVRSGVLGMVVNVVLTVPLAFVGVIPVVAATAVGQMVASLYILRRSRQELGSDIPSFLRDIPVLRAVACGAITVALQLAIAPFLPSGPVGLLACGIPAAVGLACYAVSLLGPRRVWQSAQTVIAERSLRAALAGTPLA